MNILYILSYINFFVIFYSLNLNNRNENFLTVRRLMSDQTEGGGVGSEDNVNKNNNRSDENKLKEEDALSTEMTEKNSSSSDKQPNDISQDESKNNSKSSESIQKEREEKENSNPNLDSSKNSSESTTRSVDISEHNSNNAETKDENGEETLELEINENADRGQEPPNRLHFDNIDDEVPHYSALRYNKVEKDVTDDMLLYNMMSHENKKSCSINNGGCSDDQLCININNIGVKCICKDGYLLGTKCILLNSYSFHPFFSIIIYIILFLLLFV
ncbi:merozoite surface protein 5 [Plasmodium sp. gorilla clade G2]|uniref:merozoite surface protein 5 n=1 Tax=Plasmodium sp. gorilla clade G2 TaxID=880535 RepID=UPI000D217BA4|nr:merozoite surface protein 5 [Plasmodium sp. gorilla clade G2]SOV10523.1 merozoite surface protein 5 [Plasmodium sp. gorilla clade G2]